MSNNNNNNDQDGGDPPVANQPPEEEEEANGANNNNNANAGDAPPPPAGQAQGGGGDGGVCVSSDDAAANSSEGPESTGQEEGTASHSSDSAGSKAEKGKEGGVEGSAEGGGGGGSSSSGDAAPDPNGDKRASQKPTAVTSSSKKRPSSKSGDPNEHSIAAREPTFPVKLHRILSNPEHEEVISWLPHGRSWRIHQQKRFEEEVLPIYFRHGRYSSFCRQVNGWGFRRVLQGSDYNSYYHELFLRNLPHLCERMRRLTTKDIASRRNENHAVPDFYSLSREHPLPETPSDSAEIDLAPIYVAAAQAGPHSTVADYTTSKTSIVASAPTSNPQQMPATIQGGTALMQTELQMLEKRRKEIVDRIAFLAANLGQSTASASTGTGSSTPHGSASLPHSSVGALAAPSVPGLEALQSLLTGQSAGGPVAAAVQPGMMALLQKPGGAQMLAQLLQGIQNNNSTTSQQQPTNIPMLPPSPSPAPSVAAAQNPLFSIPGGMQMVQQLISSVNNSSGTSSLQVNAPAAPVAPAPMPASSQMGEAQVLVERLMQILANQQPLNNATTTTHPSLTVPAPVLSTTFATSAMQAAQPQTTTSAALAPQPPPTGTGPPAGIPDTILQMISAAAAPSAPISNMPQQPVNNNYAAGQQQQPQVAPAPPVPAMPNAILQMLSAAMAPAVAAPTQQPQPQQQTATTSTSAAPAVATTVATPPFEQPVPEGPAQQQQQLAPGGGAPNNPPEAMMQLLQNGNIDIASLLSSMSQPSSLQQQDKSQGK